MTAIAAVTLLSLLATQLHGAAVGRLTVEIDAHWRGAYDILVRPSSTDLGIARTGGMVEPNFVALSPGGGISIGQWQAIRSLPDVQVAAPIGWVGSMKGATGKPTIEVTKFPSQPTLYEARLRVTTSDGLTDRLLYETTQHVLLGPGSTSASGPLALTDGGDVLLGTLEDGAPVADVATSAAPPQVQSPILAVDPESERALLGESGAMFDALIELRNRDDLTTLSANPQMVLPGYNQRLDIAILARRTLSRPVIPVIVSAKTYAPVRVTLDVTQLGKPLTVAVDPSAGAGAVADALKHVGSTRMDIGSSSSDASSSLRAFRLNPIAVAWPGTSLTDAGVGVQVQAVSGFTAGVFGRPDYGPASPPAGLVGPAMRIAPRGAVSPGGPSLAVGSSGQGVGSEQSYRAVSELSIPIAGPGSSDNSFAPFIFAPIAEYDLASLGLPKDPLAYVPFGAYDEPDTTFAADANGQVTKPRSMTPTLNPAGLITVPPMGIVDIRAAQLLRGGDPIDAIRVRLADLDDYGPASLDRLSRVAAQISAMGLDATIVAASSPQVVNIFVPEYEPGSGRDLGWVRQHWTTLGATPVVERVLGDANVALLGLALFAVAIVIVGSELATASGRRREAEILLASGWKPGVIRWWQATESMAAGAFVASAGVLFWILRSGEPAGLAVSLFGLVLFVLAGLIGAALAVSGTRRAGRAARRPFGLAFLETSVVSMSVGALIGRPLRTAVAALGQGLAAATIAAGVTAVATTAARAGPTALAAALAARLGGYELAMLAIVGASAAAFTVLTMRHDRRTRSLERRILAASGWHARDLQQQFRTEGLMIAALAAIVAFPVGFTASTAIVGEAGVGLPAALMACLLCGSTVAWGALAVRRI